MKFKIKITTYLLVFLTFCITLFADTLELKNGLKLEGTYKGGSETSIKFETSGAVQELAITEIKSLTFSAPAASATAAAGGAAVAPAAEVSSATGPMTVPAGTMMMVH